MARGWESKSVEGQVEDSQSKKKSPKTAQSTPEQVEAHRRREVLLLSRARVERELRSSQNPRYIDQLNQALADLDAQISKLGDRD
ncbi:MAG TPA: hypothetical protein VLY23_10630 [Candidatus Acidoferrum sp.]|nr:hypothetical protein [Candidatus Acidoferrum sp.]